ncbi:hypothetical protein J8995_08140 [Klebsiella quasipneumoniae subsp. quasipneumoniae]|uniref:hypothetical protein n=1 Tax=Klebsiella/Raoultella group TaxID=2890311 RepID=UPI00080287F0|nr:MULTISPECIES: hypothetical protein [Klebsiella]ELJ5746008.1 hypothetical protein [Klebsiella quasipneumoniae]HAT2373755.1 hypothetical protein [Raoultella ornithinolytica]HCB1497327.1 hypothetical protein [Klebsiella michiganensis]HCB1844524.1 hypothetical protein [Klebsiella oxytoca]HCI6316003.1 hypothetical protein [Klebsiella quasipneumoniae subsp. similipneumoniae]
MGMPLREYYRIHRAADLLKCEVEDLLHWASIGAIKLYTTFESGSGVVRFFGDGINKEKRDLKNFTEAHFESSLSLRNEFLKMPVISDGFSYVFRTDGNQCSEGVPSNHYLCNFSGLWALPYSAYGIGVLYAFQPRGYDFWPSVNSKMFISFDMDSTLDFDINSLCVIKSDFVLIKDCKEGKELPSYINGGVRKLNLDHGTSATRPAVKNYHAEHREEVLMAALYLKKSNPEECTNFNKWAEAINNHAHKFWSNGEPPLSVKTMAELLGKAHKIPSKK